MNNQYLNLLAKQILSLHSQGFTKVRFAKVIYFAHKALVFKDLASREDLKFIRMPLGPVPVGFKNLKEDSGILVSSLLSATLAYDMQIYKIAEKSNYLGEKTTHELSVLVNQLTKFSTSSLVEEVHKDPSWINHKNGEEYYIESGDLTRLIPQTTVKLDEETDSKHLQAKLIEGMMDEIVDESTSLEYPHLIKEEN